MAIRVAHFSDVHLTAAQLGWKRRDVLSKKVTGWLNVKLLGRGHRFRHAPMIAEQLAHDLAKRSYDLAVFTGDATKLAFDSEFRISSHTLGVGRSGMPPTICVPGNHDLYIGADVKAGQFERVFAPWMIGVRVNGETFPYATQVGHCWFIAVNSARSNFWPFDASGKIGPEQLKRLRTLCDSLSPGPRILITHYPLRKANGQPEAVTRRLRDHRIAARVAAESGISLWLHGHIHRGFVLPASHEIPFPSIGAGSATQTDRWQYNEYVIEGERLSMQKRRFDFDSGEYKDAETVELSLRTMSLG